jgi:predicted RNA binding protein YcfA (HicA-like mRNA interferase family)
MPKIPRDVSGKDLTRKLSRLGYAVERQTGSHIRLSCEFAGRMHYLTIPDHSPLKIGTFSNILSDVAHFHGITKPAVVELLFDD